MISVTLMIFGAALMLTGLVTGVCTFLQIVNTFAKNEGVTIDGCHDKVFPKFYRYAVCIAVFGGGTVLGGVGLVWHLLSKFA